MILWVNSAGTGWFCFHPCLSADTVFLLCPASASSPWPLVLGCTQAPVCIRDIFYSTEKYTHYLVITLIISFIYFWLCWVFVAVWAFSSCSEQGWLHFCACVFHCSGFSCCGARTGSRACGFSSHGSWASGAPALWLACGLGWSETRGIFLNQGSNLCLLHRQANSLPLSHQGSRIL